MFNFQKDACVLNEARGMKKVLLVLSRELLVQDSE